MRSSKVAILSLCVLTQILGCAALGTSSRKGAEALPEPLQTEKTAGYRKADLAWVQLAKGDTQGALAHFQSAKTEAPTDARRLLGLGLLHHDRGDLAEARETWMQILEFHDPRDPWAAPIAELAAHRLLALINEPPGPPELEGPHAERVATLARRISTLPPEAQQLFWAYAGQVLRLRGREDAARTLDQMRGCPQVFYVGDIFGNLPRLHLQTSYPPDHPAKDPGRGRYRRVLAYGCELATHTDKEHPGVRHAVTYAQAKEDQIVPLVVEANGETWALYVDGTLRYKEDAPQWRRHLQLRLTKGWHSIALKLSMTGGTQKVQLALPGLSPYTGAAGEAPKTADPGEEPALVRRLSTIPKTAPRRPSQRLIAEILAAQQAYITGDTDAGVRAVDIALQIAPHAAPAQVLRAAILSEDRFRPQRLVRDRVRRALEAALKDHPDLLRTRLNLAQVEVLEDHPDRALQLLAETPKEQKEHWEALLSGYKILKARSWLREAEEVLGEVRKRAGASCQVLDAVHDLRREFRDDAGALKAAKEYAACNPYSERYAEALRSSGDLEGATKEYERYLTLEPESENARSALFDVLVASGALPKRATELILGLIADFPRAASYRLKLVNFYIGQGQRHTAEAALRKALAEIPESQELQTALTSFGGEGVMQRFRVDGIAAIAEYQKHHEEVGAGPTDAAVIVLDRTVVKVLASGARLTLTHNIMHVLTKDGAEKFGEVRVPEGAEVLTLRTVKADGTTREPEEITEKETVSAPNLESGDFVEFEYIDRDGPPGAFVGGFLGERFYFASADAPLFRTEFVLATPKDLKLQLDPRGAPAALSQQGIEPGAPKPKEVLDGDLRIQTWARRVVPRLLSEPPQSEGLAVEWIPSIRPAARVDWTCWRDFLRDRLYLTRRPTDDMRRLVASLVKEGQSPEAQARVLYNWVLSNIKHGGTLDEAASDILARKEGHRLTLLSALYQIAGIPNEVLFARPLASAQVDGEIPLFELYQDPLLAVKVPGGKTIYVDPPFRYAPFGLVRPSLRGGQALRVLSDDPTKDLFTKIDVPQTGAGPADLREMTMKIVLSEDGSGEVTVKERLFGWPSVEWRQDLERLPEDKVRNELEQRSLGFYFPGASLLSLTYGPVEDVTVPLSIEYTFRAPRLARVRQGDAGSELVLPAPYPALLSRRYVGVPQRRTTLLLAYVVPTSIDLQISLPPGAGKPSLPPPIALTEFGTFHQSVGEAGPHLRMKAGFSLPTMRVPPDRYPSFIQYARAIDGAEQAAVVIPLSPSK